MSQRQATPVQTANGANGPTQLSPRRRPTLPPIKAYSPANGQSQHEQRAESPTSAVGPSPKESRPPASATFPESRSFKVNSMLNPTGSNDETASQRSSIPPDSYPHRSTPESPASSNGPLTPGRPFPPINGSPQLPNARHPIPPQMLANRGPGGTTIAPPTATIDAKKSPFLSNHVKAPYPPIEIPHGRSTPPIGVKPIYPYQQSNLIKSEDRRESDASQIIPSQSNSPTTSMTSYGTTGSRTSPVLQYAHCVIPSDHLQRAGAPGSAYGSQANGQGSIQMMTIDTDQGPVQVPVDVQAASKMADEKRKRNAGASARFRQRRKEKEREASQTIGRLESKVRELTDEKEFYRVERDYFRQLVYNSSAQAQVVPRPPSPRQRKTSIDTSSTGTPEWQQNGERGNDDGRNQRRRISGYYEAGPGQAQPPSQAQGPPPTSHNPHATYPPQQPNYAYPPDPRSRPPPPPHDRTPIPGQSPISGPPPLRPGHYETGIPQGYERGYFPPRA